MKDSEYKKQISEILDSGRVVSLRWTRHFDDTLTVEIRMLIDDGQPRDEKDVTPKKSCLPARDGG